MKNAWRIIAAVWFGLGTAQWLHASPFAYVTHQNGVSVVDLGFRAVIAELPGSAATGVAVRPEIGRVYAVDQDRVHVIDMRPQTTIATAPLSTIGKTIVMHPTRPEAYVVTDHCAPHVTCTPVALDVVRIFNTDNNTLGDGFDFFTNARIAFSADGKLLFVASGASVDVLNAVTRQVIATIAVGRDPQGMAVDGAGLLYVAVHGENAVALIDTVDMKLLARVAVGAGPSELVLSGSRLYVANTGGNTVSVVDRASRTLVATIPVGQRPLGIDATPNGEQVVVANNGESSVSLIETASLSVSGTIAVGPSPVAMGRFIAGSSAPQLPDVLTGLWWNPAEPGWGVHVAHRGTKIFAAWFTYNANGAPKWYVSSDCTLNSPSPAAEFTGAVSCSGNIYDTTGPRFFSDPYNPGNVSVNKLGFIQMVFNDRITGSMSVGIGSSVKSMPLKRQVFRTQGPSPNTDYTDLWWNPAEAGWGIGITQQFGTMFLTWFAYDDTGSPAWYVASNCVMNTSNDGCTGDVYRTSGPVDPLRNPFDPSKVKVTTVGTITASFSDANTGSLGYTIDGRSGSKQITRQLF